MIFSLTGQVPKLDSNGDGILSPSMHFMNGATLIDGYLPAFFRCASLTALKILFVGHSLFIHTIMYVSIFSL